MDPVLLARMQFAANMSFHILFPTISIALAWALLFFRWAALVTWLAGATILGNHLFEALFFQQKALIPIGVGAWLGTIMLFNVWALIWPNQKKILGLVQASDEEKGKARRTAFLASRLNVALSIPMLFFMVASGGIFRTALFPIAS